MLYREQSPILNPSIRSELIQSMEKHQQQQRPHGGGAGDPEHELSNSNKKMRPASARWLRDRKVREVVRDKRRLVEVPYTATLAQTVHILMTNGIVGVAVAAPPGHWIGAGGSMILESDKVTGAVRKHYIGMVTMFDVLAHISEEGGGAEGWHHGEEVAGWPDRDLDRRMSVPVSSIIGHSLEGLTLWTLNPNTSILDCMETFSKGVHRALVPLESQANSSSAVELAETSPGYRMLTQIDVVSFLREQGQELKDVVLRSVEELRAINENVFAVSENTRVIDAINSMRAAGLNAVPVVEEGSNDSQILKSGKGKKLVETFSATDLRGCPIVLLQQWLSTSLMEFKKKLYMRASRDSIAPIATHDPNTEMRRLITCYYTTSLADVVELAVSNHVHRVWVLDREGLLNGVVSLTDMLRAIRDSAFLAEKELKDVIPHEQTQNA